MTRTSTTTSLPWVLRPVPSPPRTPNSVGPAAAHVRSRSPNTTGTAEENRKMRRELRCVWLLCERIHMTVSMLLFLCPTSLIRRTFCARTDASVLAMAPLAWPMVICCAKATDLSDRTCSATSFRSNSIKVYQCFDTRSLGLFIIAILPTEQRVR